MRSNSNYFLMLAALSLFGTLGTKPAQADKIKLAQDESGTYFNERYGYETPIPLIGIINLMLPGNRQGILIELEDVEIRTYGWSFLHNILPDDYQDSGSRPGTVKQLGEYLSTNIKDPIISESEDRVTVSGNDDEGAKTQQSCVLDFGDEVYACVRVAWTGQSTSFDLGSYLAKLERGIKFVH